MHAAWVLLSASCLIFFYNHVLAWLWTLAQLSWTMVFGSAQVCTQPRILVSPKSGAVQRKKMLDS